MTLWGPIKAMGFLAGRKTVGFSGRTVLQTAKKFHFYRFCGVSCFYVYVKDASSILKFILYPKGVKKMFKNIQNPVY